MAYALVLLQFIQATFIQSDTLCFDFVGSLSLKIFNHGLYWYRHWKNVALILNCVQVPSYSPLSFKAVVQHTCLRVFMSDECRRRDIKPELKLNLN